MEAIRKLLDNNRAWAVERRRQEPDCFWAQTGTQNPRDMWIGCADSRVPETHITGMGLGEMFVHRNVANQVQLNDPNLTAALEFAIEVLAVEHVILCGHTQCMGVQSVLDKNAPGYVECWLAPLHELATVHGAELKSRTHTGRAQRLAELNVVQGVQLLAGSEIVQRAWRLGRTLHLHGWIYGLEDGLIRTLGVSSDGDGRGRFMGQAANA
jgi:carbonic anhydrase